VAKDKKADEPKAEKAPDWRDPDYKPADDDTSLDAEMWRLANREPVTQ